jgi:hypothetical protein
MKILQMKHRNYQVKRSHKYKNRIHQQLQQNRKHAKRRQTAQDRSVHSASETHAVLALRTSNAERYRAVISKRTLGYFFATYQAEDVRESSETMTSPHMETTKIKHYGEL